MIRLAEIRDRPLAVYLAADAGADPRFVDKDGNTAVIMARQNGYKRVVKILEQVG